MLTSRHSHQAVRMLLCGLHILAARHDHANMPLYEDFPESFSQGTEGLLFVQTGCVHTSHDMS
jgi:hypothetical protein